MLMERRSSHLVRDVFQYWSIHSELSMKTVGGMLMNMLKEISYSCPKNSYANITLELDIRKNCAWHVKPELQTLQFQHYHSKSSMTLRHYTHQCTRGLPVQISDQLWTRSKIPHRRFSAALISASKCFAAS